MFQLREGSFELKRRSPEDAAINNAWITRTRLVAEGLGAQPYIHLDIRTPFGESVDDSQVESALAESLGHAKDRFAKGGWHIQFVEDTNLGSNHRVFVDLKETDRSAAALGGMDAAIPLEVAVEALGEALMAKLAEPTFQLLVGGPAQCFSALYVNGSPFHVLRIPQGAGEKAASRLARHRDFAQSQGKGTAFRTFLCPGDALADCEAIRKLGPEFVDLGLKLPEGDRDNTGPAKADSQLYLHLGLALAAGRRELAEHNRVIDEGRQRNEGIRGRARFGMAVLGTALGCLLVVGAFALAIRLANGQAAKLEAQAAAYQSQVEAIRALRAEKSDLAASLNTLKPLWRGAVPWGEVFADLSAAMPVQSGIDGLQVDANGDGSQTLSFRAWVKDWDAVRGIERKLIDSRFLEAVSISEQRKDLASGAVVFHVSCKVER